MPVPDMYVIVFNLLTTITSVRRTTEEQCRWRHCQIALMSALIQDDCVFDNSRCLSTMTRIVPSSSTALTTKLVFTDFNDTTCSNIVHTVVS